MEVWWVYGATGKSMLPKPHEHEWERMNSRRQPEAKLYRLWRPWQELWFLFNCEEKPLQAFKQGNSTIYFLKKYYSGQCMVNALQENKSENGNLLHGSFSRARKTFQKTKPGDQKPPPIRKWAYGTKPMTTIRSPM